MRELNHNTLRYEGEAGESVTITVTAEGTQHLVTYVLDGDDPVVLGEGETIEFDLKEGSGDVTHLQLNLDFAPNGSYDVVVLNVTGCTKDPDDENQCKHNWVGPLGTTKNFKFFVQ